MNGVIIYDSYAKLTGCEKIVKYFEERTYEKVDHNILFTKDEVKQAYRDCFSEKARERDFTSD